MFKHLTFLFTFCVVSIFTFAQEKAITTLNNKKSYLKTKLNITFCGKTEGSILLDSLLNAKEILIPDTYSLKSLTIYFGGGNSLSEAVMASLCGKNLSALSSIIKRCRQGTKIFFVDIKIIKDNKIYDAPDMSFTVIEKL
jgi:hypothetical protein